MIQLYARFSKEISDFSIVSKSVKILDIFEKILVQVSVAFVKNIVSLLKCKFTVFLQLDAIVANNPDSLC